MHDYHQFLLEIKKKRPVVQCITNIVTVNDCANALLAIGASPTMAHHPEEMEDFAEFSDALVCNMGATESLEAMERAIRYAARAGHPVVLDPVGCAGSPYRRQRYLDLMEAGAITCVRGNAAEIRALAQNCNTGRGVDDKSEQPGEALTNDKSEAHCESIAEVNAEAGTEKGSTADYVMRLAARTGGIVIASGEVDYIGDREHVIELHGGSPMMPQVTGSGCMLSALLGAFMAVEPSAESAAACCAMMNACGEQAQEWTMQAGRGTGTFHVALLDALSMI